MNRSPERSAASTFVVSPSPLKKPCHPADIVYIKFKPGPETGYWGCFSPIHFVDHTLSTKIFRIKRSMHFECAMKLYRHFCREKGCTFPNLCFVLLDVDDTPLKEIESYESPGSLVLPLLWHDIAVYVKKDPEIHRSLLTSDHSTPPKKPCPADLVDIEFKPGPETGYWGCLSPIHFVDHTLSTKIFRIKRSMRFERVMKLYRHFCHEKGCAFPNLCFVLLDADDTPLKEIESYESPGSLLLPLLWYDIAVYVKKDPEIHRLLLTSDHSRSDME